MKQNRRDDDTDALFTLPLNEFTAARNALAARLKKSGKSDEADHVKALAKPSVSAWSVNQLYWKHRQAFDRLLATGKGFRHAQASQLAGKAGSMREQAQARREALSELLRLADGLLRESGHNPTSETMRHISTTLEALSAYASLPNAPVPGRLSEDLAPPGFEALAGLMPPPIEEAKPSKVPVASPHLDKKPHQSALAAAHRSVKQAESALKNAQARAKTLDAELRDAVATSKDAAKRKREAEEYLKKATAAADEAQQHASRAAAEAEAAAGDVKNAERVLEQASKEREKISGEGNFDSPPEGA